MTTVKVTSIIIDVTKLMSDEELVRQLLPHWYATRTWAEEILVSSLGLTAPEDVLLVPHRGRKSIPGLTWHYRTHGIGVDIDRGLNCGGIDFDFDKADPDPWQLRIFAEKQLNAGNLPVEYNELILDEDRFLATAKTVLASK